MSAIRTFSATKYAGDHFQPDDSSDPHAQKRMRGYLEQIDYTAFASNKAVIGQVLGEVDAARLQRLAVAVASARARWVAEALVIADAGPAAAGSQTRRLEELRKSYEELSEVYEAARRIIERGYVAYKTAPAV